MSGIQIPTKKQKFWRKLELSPLHLCAFVLVGCMVGRASVSSSSSSSSPLVSNYSSEKTTTASSSVRSNLDTGGTRASSGGPLPYKSGLLTVGEIKQRWRLPCNYIHDGHYLHEGNEALGQVYQTLQELADDIIPVVIEVGGHDGITKSISLKSSICFHMNTLLIEASPSNYAILSKTRKYDHTVNKALCDGDGTVFIQENTKNSGENKVGGTTGTPVQCTTIDKEIDNLAQESVAHPEERSKVKLIYLILDVEGHELTAIKGIQKYSPFKVVMEGKFHTEDDKRQMKEWSEKHNLKPGKCEHSTNDDVCYNFHPSLKTTNSNTAYELLYATRLFHPEDSYKTSVASKAYRFYGNPPPPSE